MQIGPHGTNFLFKDESGFVTYILGKQTSEQTKDTLQQLEVQNGINEKTHM